MKTTEAETKVTLRTLHGRRGRTTEVVVGETVLSRHSSSVSARAAVEAAELAIRTLEAAGLRVVLVKEEA